MYSILPKLPLTRITEADTKQCLLTFIFFAKKSEKGYFILYKSNALNVFPMTYMQHLAERYFKEGYIIEQ